MSFSSPTRPRLGRQAAPYQAGARGLQLPALGLAQDAVALAARGEEARRRQRVQGRIGQVDLGRRRRCAGEARRHLVPLLGHLGVQLLAPLHRGAPSATQRSAGPSARRGAQHVAPSARGLTARCDWAAACWRRPAASTRASLCASTARSVSSRAVYGAAVPAALASGARGSVGGGWAGRPSAVRAKSALASTALAASRSIAAVRASAAAPDERRAARAAASDSILSWILLGAPRTARRQRPCHRAPAACAFQARPSPT